jgi:hypothetical protein
MATQTRENSPGKCHNGQWGIAQMDGKMPTIGGGRKFKFKEYCGISGISQ